MYGVCFINAVTFLHSEFLVFRAGIANYSTYVFLKPSAGPGQLPLLPVQKRLKSR